MLKTQHPLPLATENSDYLIEILTYEVYEVVRKYSIAISQLKFHEATKILEKFYSVLVDTKKYAVLNQPDRQALATMIASLLIFALSGELAWFSHYSLQTSCGLTLLTISLGVKVSTPSYISVSMISHSFFHYHVRKRRGYFAIPWRNSHGMKR